MKAIRFLVAAIALCLAAFYSCKKENTNSVTSDAVIRSSSAVNGCGYLVVVERNGATYSPTTLAAEFQPADSLKVRITYTLLSSYFKCANVDGSYQQIQITSISKIP